MSDETIFLVDDDPDVLDAVSFLLSTSGYRLATFDAADTLLDRLTPGEPGCLVLDVCLPRMNGLEIQETLAERGIHMPIIFITGHGDIPMAVRAVNNGALDFLEKPFDDNQLIELVDKGLARDRERRAQEEQRASIEAALDSLTPREREVMEEILRGKLNKIIAADLDMSVRTVEVHRARVLEKLGARNGSDMVRLVLSSGRYDDWHL